MQLTGQQQKQLRTLGDSHRLRFIILHGSYATGKVRPDSDIDIAVVAESPVSATDRASLYRGFSEVFGDSGKRELDFKLLYRADPLFRYQVTRDSVLLYGDTSAYAAYKRYAFRDYTDTADLRRLEARVTRAKQMRVQATLAAHR